MELNEQRRDLWELIRIYENQPFVQISAHKEIHALTKSILQLYETLPLILNNNNNNNNNKYYLILFTRIQQVYFQSFLHNVKNG